MIHIRCRIDRDTDERYEWESWETYTLSLPCVPRVGDTVPFGSSAEAGEIQVKAVHWQVDGSVDLIVGF